MSDPDAAAREISGVVGVVEHGLFLGMTTSMVIASGDGVEVKSSPVPRG